MVTTRLSRVTLWVDGFSFSPCIQRVWAFSTSTPDPSPPAAFPPFPSLSFSVRPLILCFLRTRSEARPVGQSLLFQEFEPTACFGSYGNTACGAKKHPKFRTKSPSQDLRSGINVDFPVGNINNFHHLRAGFESGSDNTVLLYPNHQLDFRQDRRIVLRILRVPVFV